MKRYPLGAIADNPDDNDRLKVVSKIPLPRAFDLTVYAGRAYNQYTVGSCTGQTLAKCSEVIARRKGTSPNVQLVSPLFTYALAREQAGWPSTDNGAFLRDVMKVSKNIGRIPVGMYSGRWDWSKLPSQQERELAGHATIRGYERIPVRNSNTITDMKLVFVEEELPIAIGARVFDSINTVRKSGIIPMPTSKDKHAGGHAMTLLGYDDSLASFIGINSWGEMWGNNGFFYLSYDYVLQYVNDIWTFSREYY